MYLLIVFLGKEFMEAFWVWERVITKMCNSSLLKCIEPKCGGLILRIVFNDYIPSSATVL